MAKPLAGVKVLDLTRVLAGPFCTLILSDLGAEVIKVEIPGWGDDARHIGPFINEQSLYFLGLNRAKKSLTLNLKKEEGKEIFKELVREFDVIIENFRPGTMDKLGLGYEVLKKLKPDLIYAASSGFGRTGPDSKKPAYDLLAQARGGIMSITGWPDVPPTRVGMSTGDITAGMFTAIAVNAALYHREKTGEGQLIDVAMLDSQVAILENALARYQVEGVSPTPIGNRHPALAPFQVFEAKDDNFILAIGNDKLWANFCRAVGKEEWITHKDFTTNTDRTNNLKKLTFHLSELFKTKNAGEWIDMIEAEGVPCGPINNIERVMQDSQVHARNMIVEVDDEKAGTIKIAGNPMKMSSLPDEKKRKPVPQLGEHTCEILQKYLGYSPQQLEQLKEAGVI
jgi:CoA:oxalate CoA-transferase